jgi:hypothetical protein
MISALYFIIIALLSMVAARPNLQRRGLPGAVYYCDGENFSGKHCTWLEPNNVCHQLEPGFIKSLGPDPDGTCTLYKDANCSAGQELMTLRFPGKGSGLPDSVAFQCSPNVNARREGAVELAVKTLDLDDRLAGGVGSMERVEHLAEIVRMEEDGFSEGLIGLKKKFYY